MKEHQKKNHCHGNIASGRKSGNDSGYKNKNCFQIRLFSGDFKKKSDVEKVTDSKGNEVDQFFDKDFVTGYMAKGAELLDKYAAIDLTATECVIKIDDAGFKAIIKELLQYLSVQFGADEEMQRDINDFLTQFEVRDILA